MIFLNSSFISSSRMFIFCRPVREINNKLLIRLSIFAAPFNINCKDLGISAESNSATRPLSRSVNSMPFSSTSCRSRRWLNPCIFTMGDRKSWEAAYRYFSSSLFFSSSSFSVRFRSVISVPIVANRTASILTTDTSIFLFAGIVSV
jgi:hypothetical protein